MKNFVHILGAAAFTGSVLCSTAVSAEVTPTAPVEISYSASTCKVVDTIILEDGTQAVVLVCVGNGNGTV